MSKTNCNDLTSTKPSTKIVKFVAPGLGVQANADHKKYMKFTYVLIKDPFIWNISIYLKYIVLSSYVKRYEKCLNCTSIFHDKLIPNFLLLTKVVLYIWTSN